MENENQDNEELKKKKKKLPLVDQLEKNVQDYVKTLMD